ncbi:hypothetical protein D9M71_628720 [compost metagenome]
MRAAGLERHHVALASGVHHRMGHFGAHVIEPGQHLQASAQAGVGPQVAPARQGLAHALEQGIALVLVVADAQFKPIGRALSANASHRRRPLQFEVLAQQRLEAGFGSLHFFLRILLDVFRVGRPVIALGNRLHGALKGMAVVFEQFEGSVARRRGHEGVPWTAPCGLPCKAI